MLYHCSFQGKSSLIAQERPLRAEISFVIFFMGFLKGFKVWVCVNVLFKEEHDAYKKYVKI